ncbi:MAG: cytochrome c [Chloroflexi bacterium]|nr:cytochrome c [Chloroflexota bacterium]
MVTRLSKWSRAVTLGGGSILLLSALLLWMGAGTARAAASRASATGSPAAGKELYGTYCSTCHGPDAKGGIKLGDATSADIRWSAIGTRYHNDPALVSRAILQGLDEEGKPLDDVMPRWKGTLTTQQVGDLVAYLQTLTSSVPGQIVATPVHEDVTPQPTEEAQEAAQKATAFAQAKTKVATTTTTAPVATPTTAAALAAATPTPASESAAVSTTPGPVIWVIVAAVAVGLLWAVWWRGRRPSA